MNLSHWATWPLMALTLSLPASAHAADGWLSTKGNHIYQSDGAIWHGRGANVQDVRSCWACDRMPISEAKRRLAVLTDDWGASFVRLTMESYDAKKNVAEDAQYLQDVLAMVHELGDRPGVYVELSLWHDPSIDEKLGSPTGKAFPLWEKLVTALADYPKVMFGLVNEPLAKDGIDDSKVWLGMNETVRKIRALEKAAGGGSHLISVQGTRNWGRNLEFYMTHPIQAGGGKNIVYETHIYDSEADFHKLLDEPIKKLPVIIGEFGPRPAMDMQQDDCVSLIDFAEANEVPWMAWNFHHNCGPDLLQATNKDSCGVGMTLKPSPWGKLIRNRLQQLR